MQQDTSTNIYVAPLQIRKANVEKPAGKQEGAQVAEAPRQDASPNPAFAMEQVQSPRPRFQNYLRASYPFEPTASPSVTTVTLPLNAGDIILIHSVHTNGWADGTQLETGARGWLPTNYCEAYDYATMRPLLRALTEFWDIVRSGSDSNLGLFQNQDYMRGIVAGVRFLLEKSDCLTRDSPYVQRHDGIRRSRKGLLSDLSLLVKAAKKLQQMLTTQTTHSQLDESLDSMLLSAFRIVTRAVKFFDIWGEEVALARSLQGYKDLELELELDNPASPPLPDSKPEVKADPSPNPRPISKASTSTRHTGSTSRYSTFSAAANPSIKDLPLEPIPKALTSPQQPPSVARQSKGLSVTHRMSYSAAHHTAALPNLASNRLNQCYDAFLGVLASFLGSHMQSRSSSELLLTTQQAVKSCRQLLAVVETVIEHDYTTSDALTVSKDAMYDAITELILAAKGVFRPLHSSSDEDMVYLPEQGRRLVQAATNCVSGAGRCVARTKSVLEEGGDFELESLPAEPGGDSEVVVATKSRSFLKPSKKSGLLISGVNSPSDFDDIHEMVQKPRSNIPQDVLTPPLSTQRGDSPSTVASSVPPTPADDQIAGIMRPTSSQTTVHSPPNLRPASHEFAMPLGHLRHKSVARTIVQSTGSDSTYDSTGANSDPSDFSRATSATSYNDNDADATKSGSQGSLSRGVTPADDLEEGEVEILKQTFAHELVFNRDGQVTGGTLNALVERLTSHHSTPDALFVSTIYLTFRLFAKPAEFAEALSYRFQYAGESQRISNPVRLRVYNAFKGWLESHWRHDCDDAALPSIVAFAREELAPVLPTAGKRLLDLAATVASTHAPVVPRVISAIGKTSTSSAAYVNPDTPLPAAILSKSQLAALRTWKQGGAGVGILDFDALELARQITLKTSQIFCSILPEELLATEWTKQSSSLAVNVRAMSTLSTDLSNLVADSILQLEEPKRRAATIKQWVKIATRCLELHNYDTIWAIVCSLDSTNIKRMRKTWDLVPQKSKNSLEELKKVVDVSKNYSTLRQCVQAQVPPCLPFLGVYLTDLTFVDHGNAATRQLTQENGNIPVINLDKHMKTAKIISDLQRFQIPYRFTEISELQTWMQDQLIRVRSAGEKNYQNHYRRSLILEPKETGKPSPNPGSGKDKERFDFLAWTHITKDKPATPPITT